MNFFLTFIAFLIASLAAYIQVLAFLHGNISSLGILIFYGIMAFLFLTRNHPQSAKEHFSHWMKALLATWLPVLMLPSAPLTPWMGYIGIPIQITGIIGMVMALLSLSFSFGIIAANRGVKTKGLYTFIRHPLYFTELLNIIGFLLQNGSVINLTLTIFHIIFQLLRIKDEEELLKQDPVYMTYSQKVKFRLIPGFF